MKAYRKCTGCETRLSICAKPDGRVPSAVCEIEGARGETNFYCMKCTVRLWRQEESKPCSRGIGTPNGVRASLPNQGAG